MHSPPGAPGRAEALCTRTTSAASPRHPARPVPGPRRRRRTFLRCGAAHPLHRRQESATEMPRRGRQRPIRGRDHTPEGNGLCLVSGRTPLLAEEIGYFVPAACLAVKAPARTPVRASHGFLLLSAVHPARLFEFNLWPVELTGLEPVTPCVQTAGSTSTRIHPRRSPSRDVSPHPVRSAPVAVLSAVLTTSAPQAIRSPRVTQLHSREPARAHDESRADSAASTVAAEPGHLPLL
jgi:hypothetical protein